MVLLCKTTASEEENLPEPLKLTRVDTLRIISPVDQKFADYLRIQLEKTYSDRVIAGGSGAQQLANLGDWLQWRLPGRSPAEMLNWFISQNALMLYPLLKMNGKLSIQIKLVAEFEHFEVSAQKQIDDIKKINEYEISKYLSHRVENPLQIPAEYEITPGKMIEYSYDYRKLSITAEIQRLVEKTLLTQLEGHKLEATVLENFAKDCTQTILKDSLHHYQEIAPGLLLTASINIYNGILNIHHDEIVYAYRIVADTFEQRLYQVAKKAHDIGYTQLLSELKEYRKIHPAKPGNLQNSQRIEGLIAIAEKHSDKISSKLNLLVFNELKEALKKLIDEMNREYEKKAEIKLHEKVLEITATIKKNSQSTSSLTVLTESEIFSAEDFKDADRAGEYSREVIKRLKSEPELCYWQNSENYRWYFAQLLFLMPTEVKAYRERFMKPEWHVAVEGIKSNLPITHPDNTNYHGMLDEFARKAKPKINPFLKAMEDLKQIQDEEEREIRRIERANNFNFSQALKTGFIGAVAGLILGLGGYFGIIASVWLVLGVTTVLSALGFYWGGKHFSKNKQLELRVAAQKQEETEAMEKKIEKREQQNKVANAQQKMAEKTFNILFPEKFKDYSERLVGGKALEDTLLENLDRLKTQIPHLRTLSEEKGVADMIHAVKSHPDVAIIQVPSEYQIAGMSSIYLIKKSDLRSASAREQLAQHFITKMENDLRTRSNSTYAGYYRFLINTFSSNSEYRKYLPGR